MPLLNTIFLSPECLKPKFQLFPNPSPHATPRVTLPSPASGVRLCCGPVLECLIFQLDALGTRAPATAEHTEDPSLISVKSTGPHEILCFIL